MKFHTKIHLPVYPHIILQVHFVLIKPEKAGQSWFVGLQCIAYLKGLAVHVPVSSYKVSTLIQLLYYLLSQYTVGFDTLSNKKW
jgi:hypothetical protein